MKKVGLSKNVSKDRGKANENFRYICVPEKPYKERYHCAKGDLIWELDIRDENHTCFLCASELKPMNQYAPLVANYVEGQEDYFSYAGQVTVKGNVQKTFTNLLVYGTGLGPIGVIRGSFLINKLGGAEVKVAEYTNFRGHGDISRAVGFIKTEVEEKLSSQGVHYELSVTAQDHDGDLKPSPRNKRGRNAMAQVRIPISDFKGLLKVDPEKFLSFVEVDGVRSKRLGCPFYSGMGGEILPAVYKATKVNPHNPLVSCFQNIYAEKDQGDVIYRVELPNSEV